MKKWLLIISATVICVAAAFLYFFSLTPKGDTITSRESILNTAISKGNEWTIAKELELGGYIVSGAYSTDNKSTLAIFEPTGNGDYKFSTSTNRNSDEIIVGGVAINGEWYDLIWFNGAKTEYAEITYTINGYDSITEEVLVTDEVDPGTEKARKELEERLEKRKAEKKETEERLEKQRAEKQDQEERQYNLKIDGKDVADLTGKMVELVGTSIPIGVTESGVSTFDVLA